MTWPDFIEKEGFQTIHKVTSDFIGGSGYLQSDALPQAAQIARMLTPTNLAAAGFHGTPPFEVGIF
jgi:hypothetical protein